MSYTALYRKFRPDTFEQVRGQDHIVRTLKNQVKTRRVGHAYLFCGTRGTGKTTLAKILAKAVNCENPVDGSPCNECAMCRRINRQASMDVIEIDAASNNGVDNVREIINEVKYSPAEGKYKVYIVDEAHMLSAGAFNALLKTLEEPPEYVIFVLATTEAHSIPITIMSRCQRYDFHRIDINTITDRLKELVGIEGLEVEERALKYVAKAADGSMRDALSLLDQCIAYHYGNLLTYDKVLEVLGAVNMDIFHNVLCGVLKKDVTGLLEIVEEVIVSGKELGRFVTEYTWFLRNLLILKASGFSEDMVDASAQDLEMLKEDAKRITFLELFRDIQIFSELTNRLKYAAQKRALLEVALVRLCIPQMDMDVDSLHLRIKELEKRLEQGIVVSGNGPGNGKELGFEGQGLGASGQSGAGQELGFTGRSGIGQESNSAGRGGADRTGGVSDSLDSQREYDEAVPEEIKNLCRDWNGPVSLRLEPALRSFSAYTLLEPGKAGENNVVLLAQNKIALMIFEESREKVQGVMEEYIGKKINLQVKMSGEQKENEAGDREKILEDIQKKINFPINVVGHEERNGG